MSKHMKNEIRSVKLDFTNTDEEMRIIEGYASVFDEEYTLIYDYDGEKFFERILPGAFLKTLADESKEQFFLINHDWDKVVGRTSANLELREDAKGLYFKATIPNTTLGNDLLENVKSGIIQGCSFGFRIVDEKVRWDDKWNFYRDITEVQLNEITATTHPCYKNTSIEARSSIKIKELKDLEIAKQKQDNKRGFNKDTNMSNADMLLCFLSSFNTTKN